MAAPALQTLGWKVSTTMLSGLVLGGAFILWVYVYGHIHATVHVWRSEFSLRESLPSHHVGSSTRICVVGVGSKCLYPPSHLASPTFSIETSSLTGLELFSWARWPAKKPRGSTCLCLPRARMTSTCCYAWLLNVGCGHQIKSSCLEGKHFTN